MIDLKLTPAETAVLFRILSAVGGDPNGYRGKSQSILDKLYAILGVVDYNNAPYPDILGSGHVMIEDDCYISTEAHKQMQELIDKFAKYATSQNIPSHTFYNASRVDRLEATIESLQEDMTDLQADMNALRNIINF